MIQKKIKITHEHGLHMRPAMMVTDAAAKFDSEIIISKEDGMTANAESIMQVAMLAITQGTEVTITAEGADEQKAIDALVELIVNNFDMSSVKD